MAYFITRRINVGKRNCIRIVDIISDFNPDLDLKNGMQKLLGINESEYIDCYNYGVNKDVLQNWGFVLKKENEVIVPNYFEPFLKKNINLKFAYKSQESIKIFKGDSDQDRPNII